MKKIVYIVILTVIITMFTGIKIYANSEIPQYDETYDNGKGIFYANGSTITIKEDDIGNTVVYWDGGQQIVPQTVRIIGGGEEGSNFSQSNIIMESGVVSHIYGGGASLNENNLAVVEKSNIIMNGGTILQTIYGGGLLFTNTTEANITINNGNVKSICGGGSAAATISATTYAAGISTDLQNSKNRTQTTSITINGGTVESSIFGGGQGYSYVGNSTIKINAGDLSAAYVVAGGSNGYTNNSNVQISGGQIYAFQTVNRGEMENAIVRIDGGSIETAYVGGENDSSVTGIINNIDFAILKGNVTNLYPGVSAENPITIDQNEYKVAVVEGTVENSQLSEQEVKIQYEFNILEDSIKIERNRNYEIQTQINTIPTGYEHLFNNEKISWNSSDTTVVTIDENGSATGITKGNGTITANFLEEQDAIEVQVIDTLEIVLIIVLIGIVPVLIWYNIE